MKRVKAACITQTLQFSLKEELWKQYQKVQSGIIARRKAAEEKKRLAAERTMANRTNSNFSIFPKKR